MRAAAGVFACCAAALVTAAPCAFAETSLAIGLSGGVSRADAARANYRWDEAAHGAFGARALAGHGRAAVGARVERTSAMQSLALGGSAPEQAVVRGTSLEAVARWRVVSFGGVDLAATGGAGRTWYAWSPERVDVNTGSGVTTVRFAPVAVPSASAGAEAALGFGGWRMALSAERRFVTLDTAHRAGDTVVYAKETFGDWNARLELARTFALGAEGRTR